MNFELPLRDPLGWPRLPRGLVDQWAQLTFDGLACTDEAMAYVIDSEGTGRVMPGTRFSGRDQEDDIVPRVTALPNRCRRGARRIASASSCRPGTRCRRA